MAEQERLTKAERREQKRLRRQEEERQAAEQAKRDRRRNISYGVSLVAIVGVLVYLAVGNLTTSIDSAITLARAEVEDAQAAAGCEVLDVELITDADVAQFGYSATEHIDPATAPAPDVLYTKGQPTASGPHFTNPLPIVNGVRDEPIDQRGSTHNMEHGSIIVWIDRDQVPQEDVDDIADWVELLNENGFAENTGRAGIMASYVGETGISSGKALAIRGWGVGMDCDSWDRDWANGFTLDNYGPRGLAPEDFQEFPEETLAYADGEGTEGGEDADSEGGEDADSEGGEGAGDDEVSEEPSAAEPSDEPSDEPSEDES